MIFLCPKCKQELRCEESRRGELLDCPKCKETIQVPQSFRPAGTVTSDSKEFLSAITKLHSAIQVVASNVSAIEKYVRLFYILVIINLILAALFFAWQIILKPLIGLL
jgi:uncharacterized protein YbaR (Trm112 family)